MKFLPDLSLTGWPQGASGVSAPLPAPDPPLLPDLAYDARLLAFMPAQLFADTAGTILAGVNDAVARLSDTSGTGTHATQPIVAARPHRREGDGLDWLDFDGVDDRLVIAPDASWVKNGLSLLSVLRAPLSTDRLVLLGNAGTSETAIAGYMQDGETFNSSIGIGTPDYFANGAFIGTNINRTQAHAAWVTGGWVIAEVAHMDLVGSAIGTQGAQFPGWRSRTSELGPVEWGAQILIPTAILDIGTNRADLVAHLANTFGITLP